MSDDKDLKRRIEEAARNITRMAIDEGQLVELGWRSFRAITVPSNASEAQLYDMRLTFFAGAQHLWSSIMGATLDEGDDASDEETARMNSIHEELERFRMSLQKPEGPVQ